jgi:hypothetical protein
VAECTHREIVVGVSGEYIDAEGDELGGADQAGLLLTCTRGARRTRGGNEGS